MKVLVHSKKGLVIFCLVYNALLSFIVYEYKTTDFTKTCNNFYINGVDCSVMSVDDIAENFNKKYGDRDVNIKVNKDTYTCKVKDLVDVEFDKESIVRQVGSTDIIRYFFDKNRIDVVSKDYYTQNDEKCAEWLKENVLINKVSSTDAYINRKSDTEFEIIPETLGSEFNTSDVLQITYDKINELSESNEKSVDIDYTEYCKKPQILKDNAELVEKLDKINKYLDTSITMTFGEDKKVIDKEELSKHIKDNGKITYGWLDDYVDELATEVGTVGKSRKFKTNGGKRITVKGGIYGWILDKEKTKSGLKKAIKSGGVQEYVPEYTQTAQGWGDNEIGDSYVEVSIEKQTVWVYKNGKKVFESSVVTGLEGNSNRRTLRGTHFIMYKVKDTYLKGATWNTHVDYFMPFNYSGQGFHDANWRSSFGGSIYLSNGSHGCVNMPPSKAKELYELVEAGMPVVVY